MEGNLQSVLKVARMEVTQNRGLTLCPTDVLSDSDDETPEDLGLSTSLSIHLREDHGTFLLVDTYSLSPGVWQSFVTIRSCNHLMRIISTYVDNTKKSEIS